jgi:hypothetical protein
MSACGGKADIIQGKADIKKCPLMTQSRHRRIESARVEKEVEGQRSRSGAGLHHPRQISVKKRMGEEEAADRRARGRN